MLELLFHILAWLQPTDALEAMRQVVPELPTSAAADHLAAAQIASVLFNVEPELVLSIAYHESRFSESARTAEPGHKTSCGVMTPIPKAICETPSLLGGYLEGAEHLRTWIDAEHGNMHAALLGYAGGYRMIKACSTGPVLIDRRGRDVDLCAVVDAFLSRAAMIRQRLNAARRTRS